MVNKVAFAGEGVFVFAACGLARSTWAACENGALGAFHSSKAKRTKSQLMTTFNFGNTWVPTSILIEIFEASDRAAIIVGVALIDNAITHRIKSKLLPPSTSKDSLFDHDDRPLQSLSAKINLAERLGLITPQFARLLHRARDIRNKFAHQVIVQDNVIDKCNSIIKDYFYIIR